MKISTIARFWLVWGLFMLLVALATVDVVSAETCPSSGRWPFGCTPAGQTGGNSQQGYPCPATGKWPAGCNPALSPTTPTRGTQPDAVPCPATGAWPQGCDPNLQPAEEEYIRPITSIIKSAQLWGKGELHMNNGLARDAAVFLTPLNQRTAVAVVYIRAGEQFSLKGIRDGMYEIYIATGEDWDSATNTFTTGAQYSKFDEPDLYETEWMTSSYIYTVVRVTLHPTSNGNATTSSVSPANFPR